MHETLTRTIPGPVLFARYTFPPNFHGFRGPSDHGTFFEHGVAGVDDAGLRAPSQPFVVKGPTSS
ncbi:MAG: hypothetical protein QOI76_3935 [Frankiales bacterium]|nr:hypothetical protein [Frankiales bacterium]